LSATSTSTCPCNAGLPGGPLTVKPGVLAKANITTPETASSSSRSQCPCNTGLANGPSVLAPTTITTFETATSSSRSQCPCNIGLPNGPLTVKPVDHGPTVISTPAGSFDWSDAGAGAGFTAAIGLLASGAALMLRRHRLPAPPHS
jgi:hypothetical protein